MSEIYKIFSRDWDHIMDYSEESLVEMFNYETYGTEIKDKKRNGYYVGKQWLNVHIEMWKEDMQKGYLLVEELYIDPLFPHWWLDRVFKNILP